MSIVVNANTLNKLSVKECSSCVGRKALSFKNCEISKTIKSASTPHQSLQANFWRFFHSKIVYDMSMQSCMLMISCTLNEPKFPFPALHPSYCTCTGWPLKPCNQKYIWDTLHHATSILLIKIKLYTWI